MTGQDKKVQKIKITSSEAEAEGQATFSQNIFEFLSNDTCN